MNRVAHACDDRGGTRYGRTHNHRITGQNRQISQTSILNLDLCHTQLDCPHLGYQRQYLLDKDVRIQL